MGLKKILLISTGQPSCNPRIVKEADALHNAGYEVTVLFNYFINWAEEKDKNLLKKAGWEFIKVGGSPFENKWLYLFTRIRNKICRLLSKYGFQPLSIAEKAQARCYNELLQQAKKIKADWYIAHNLGALAVAVKAAAFNKAKAGFDFEDYYRGELAPDDIANLKRVVYLEKKYLSSVNYISAASSMITVAVKNDFPFLDIPFVTLNNCFPLKQQPPFQKKQAGDDTLKLFWFSQTIGINRGLEILIEAISKINDPSTNLTLVGRCDESILAYINAQPRRVKESIHFAGIIDSEELPAFASKFDVGMAVELQKPFNREICLTNKIFTYLLAGNAIILSQTAMQTAFNKKYSVGESFVAHDLNGLVEKIKYYKNREMLNAQKLNNYELAKGELNWEEESKKLLAIFN